MDAIASLNQHFVGIVEPLFKGSSCRIALSQVCRCRLKMKDDGMEILE